MIIKSLGGIQNYLNNLEKSPEFKKIVDNKILELGSKGIIVTANGKQINIQSLQQKLHSCLVASTSGIIGKYSGETFLNHFSIGGWHFTGNILVGNVLMTGEMMRPSLTGKGEVNIAYLFNNGYSAKRTVWGYYSKYGVYARSLQSRAGLHFVQEAIENFKSYCAGLGVVVQVNYDSGFN